MPWFVLYTKSRNEKKVANTLREQGIDVYCPLIRVERKWTDRLQTVETPLFSSYCFVNLEEQERPRVFSVPGIVRYLFWLDKPAVVRDEEIEAIKRMLNEFDNRLIKMDTFSPADRVRISSGAFTDVEGGVITQQGKTLTIFVDSLQMMLNVDLSKTLVSA